MTPGRSELGLYVQRRVQTYPGARQTPDFGTFAFDDRGEMAIPLVIECARKLPEEPATAASPPAWLDLIDLDDPSEPASGTESPSSAAASRTGDETGGPTTAELGPAPPAASADDTEPAPPAEARPRDVASDDADALADARVRAAAAMEQAWAARQASRRELEDRTGGEVQTAESEVAAPHEWHEPIGQPRQAPSAWQPAVSPVPTAHEDQVLKLRDVTLDSDEASASGVAGEIAGTNSAPRPSPHTLTLSTNNASWMAPRPEPAKPSTELISTPGPRRPRRSTPILPPLPLPAEISNPDAPTPGVRHKMVDRAVVVGATLAITLIAYAILGHTWSQLDARLRGAVSHPPDAAPGITLGGPSDARPPSAGPPARDCPVGMVPVPAGTFLMGSPGGIGNADEHPQHKVTLSVYCIDRTEVTVKAYADCVRAGGCTAAPRTVQWNGASVEDVERYSRFCNREDRPDHPLNCVDWNQAAVYCLWAGKRLPTEAEWEYAARGSDGRAYPWDDEAPSATRLNACGSECVAMARRELKLDWTTMYDASDGWEATAPVGSFPGGVSPSGALDMAGNVWEWTADWYGTYPGTTATNPHGAQMGTARVIRGGAWDTMDGDHVRAAGRDRSGEANRSRDVGFRCALGPGPYWNLIVR